MPGLAADAQAAIFHAGEDRDWPGQASDERRQTRLSSSALVICH
jgi:hypothetical protein